MQFSSRFQESDDRPLRVRQSLLERHNDLAGGFAACHALHLCVTCSYPRAHLLLPRQLSFGMHPTKSKQNPLSTIAGNFSTIESVEASTLFLSQRFRASFNFVVVFKVILKNEFLLIGSRYWFLLLSHLTGAPSVDVGTVQMAPSGQGTHSSPTRPK